MKSESGFSGVELLVVMAVMGIVLGMAASNLRVIANPAQHGASEVMGYLKHARARAVSTTSAYTVRPLSTNTLQALTGINCASADSEPDPGMPALTLPAGAYLGETDWSVCFSSRGLPTTNLEVSVHDSNNHGLGVGVEVYYGGAVRIKQ